MNDLLFVVPVETYRLTETTFAMESAFCEHLRTLQKMLSHRFPRIVLAAVGMTQENYELNKQFLGIIDEQRDAIVLTTLYESRVNSLQFWLFHYIPILIEEFKLVRQSALVHSWPGYNLLRPVELPSLILGILMGRKTISVTDIDQRDSARMLFKTKKLSLKSYILWRYIYDPIRHLQESFVCQFCSLVLYKDQKQVEDYGRKRKNIKLLIDPGFEQEYVISSELLSLKVESLKDPQQPLELLYFGRLVEYKGVDRCIQALAQVLQWGEKNVRLSIMGAGEEEQSLRNLTAELGLRDRVTFLPPVPYGKQLFETLYPFHLMLAAPLRGDTARTTWDAIASGIPLLAFDTNFYQSMAAYTGVIEVVPWPSVEALADKIARYCRDKTQLIPLTRKSVEVAHANDGERWLERRVQWMDELFESAEKL